MNNPLASEFHKLCNKIAKDLIDRGLLIRAGAKTLLTLPLPEDRNEAIRFAFFAGAEHLYSTIMNVMEEGLEPTERDLGCMAKIHKELEEWRKIAMATTSSIKGRA